MGIFSGKNEKGELNLVFDIRSQAVSGALFLTKRSGAPQIIYSAREPVVSHGGADPAKLLAQTLKSLRMVSDKIYLARLGAPVRVFCVLSSPWYFSQTRSIDLKKNAPFLFDSRLADSLTQKEIKLFGEEHMEKYGESVRAFELKNIKTSLNGYDTPDPLNKKTRELEMHIHISMSGEHILKKIEETIEKNFHTRPVKFISSVMASFSLARDMFIERENFLLVEVGGEVTDISMIKKNILRQSISFPSGRNFFIHGVSGRLGISPGESASLISLFKNGHAERSVAKKLAPVINQLREEWLLRFQESLAEISGDIAAPSTLYLSADKDVADFFKEIIQAEHFSQYSLPEGKFEIIALDPGLFHGAATFKDTVDREPFIIMDSIYINRFLNYKATALK